MSKKCGMVNRAGGYTFEGKNSLNKQWITWWNATLCGISPGSSLFAKLCSCASRVCKGVSSCCCASHYKCNFHEHTKHSKQNQICCFQGLKGRIRFSRLFNLKIRNINRGVLISLIFIDVKWNFGVNESVKDNMCYSFVLFLRCFWTVNSNCQSSYVYIVYRKIIQYRPFLSVLASKELNCQ